MRIAVVGSGRSVHALSRSEAVARRGHEVRFVTLGPVLPSKGLEVRTRPIPRGLRQSMAAARGFVNDVRSFQPDVLHLHYAGSKLGTMATLTGVRPLVVTVMGGDVLPEQHLGGLSAFERRATWRILEEADLILAKSRSLLPAIAHFGDWQGKVEVVRWGVDPVVFRRDPAAAADLRERLGLAQEARIVVSPRALQPLYNIHLLIEAFPSVRRRIPAARLLVTEPNADESYRTSLQARVQALDLDDHVHFVGRLDHAEMRTLYSLADVVVMVPASDGLPQSLFEAMASEAPVVLGRLPGYGEVVTDGETALLTDLQPASIASAVVRLLDDEAFRRDVATSALGRVREIASLPAEVDRVLGFYESLRARPPRRRPARIAPLLDLLSLILR